MRSGVYRKNLRGVQGRRSGLVRGPGAEPPRLRRIFENLQKNSRRKLQKRLYFRLFCKNISKPCVEFSRVWTKNNCLGEFWENFENFWWKFNGKIEFYLFLGRFVDKNRNFGNNIIFLQQFFPVRGGVEPLPLTPMRTLRWNRKLQINIQQAFLFNTWWCDF